MMRVVLVVLLATAHIALAQQPGSTRFRSTADFELRDGGIPQKIEAIAVEDVPVTLILALDTSQSVAGTLLQQLKSAARAAVNALLPDDHAALLTFSHTIKRVAPITADRAVLADAIDKMQAGGKTALRDAIFTATALRERAPGPRGAAGVH